MLLINCEINLILTWSTNCALSDKITNQETTFAITGTKLYVLVVTLSTQDNAKLLKQSKSGFNPNKAGLFEGSFSLGEGRGSYFKKNLSNINITLYNC